VAALVAAAVLRKNQSATVLPFEQAVVPMALNSRDSVMTNAGRLSSIGGGGTNCSAPVRLMNQRKAKADLVLFVSDNESWVDSGKTGQGRGRGTALLAEWSEFRQRNPNARLVCLDVQPNQTTQAAERADILNIGGLSDQVFEVISAFASGQLEADHWIARIEAVEV
jgi:60 kDa SS-A/Ro ribonucleoprotein